MFIKDKFLFRAKHEQEDKIDNEDEAKLKPRTDKYGLPLPFVTSPQKLSRKNFDKHKISTALLKARSFYNAVLLSICHFKMFYKIHWFFPSTKKFFYCIIEATSSTKKSFYFSYFRSIVGNMICTWHLIWTQYYTCITKDLALSKDLKPILDSKHCG